jgi:hypothetical protein
MLGELFVEAVSLWPQSAICWDRLGLVVAGLWLWEQTQRKLQVSCTEVEPKFYETIFKTIHIQELTRGCG